SRHGHSCSRHLSRSQAEIPLIPAVQISRASSDREETIAPSQIWVIGPTPATSLVFIENNETRRFLNVALKSLFDSLSDDWGEIIGQHDQMLIAKFGIVFPSA
ncbi:hypothetical protein, partial [Rhizobium sp. AN70]|uniref:hypothetical protein n=1 Tax=Rhizobium sp. AN70 TaxID=3035123 RepID=UPI0024787FC0